MRLDNLATGKPLCERQGLTADIHFTAQCLENVCVSLYMQIVCGNDPEVNHRSVESVHLSGEPCFRFV